MACNILDKALYYQDEWATIYCGDNRDILPELSGIDLAVTSPPYDGLREYGGHSFEFSDMPRLLYKSMSQGGVCVWVVGDQTINGSESGSSFRQALSFMDNGFNLHDTMIYESDKPPLTHNRYEQTFEYMFVLSKGPPKTFNPIKVPTIHGGSRVGYSFNSASAKQIARAIRGRVGYAEINDTKIKTNIWYYPTGEAESTFKGAFAHPAIFPEALASDHIISWSNPVDLILDPFMGSGTTCYCAKKLNRHSIGIEINEKYCEIAKKRLAQSVMVL